MKILLFLPVTKKWGLKNSVIAWNKVGKNIFRFCFLYKAVFEEGELFLFFFAFSEIK